MSPVENWSLYLSIKKACGAPRHRQKYTRTSVHVCIHTATHTRMHTHRLFRGSQGCLSHFGRAGQVQCSDQRGLREVLFGDR